MSKTKKTETNKDSEAIEVDTFVSWHKNGKKYKLTAEDRIFLLEQELQQAIYTVYFLHNCIITPKRNNYSYPEQTLKHIEWWEKILPESKLCGHSITKLSCESCKEHRVNYPHRKKIEEIICAN